MQPRKFVTEAGVLTTDTGQTGFLDAAGDVQILDIAHLEHVMLVVAQITDNGTVALHFDLSVDGTNFIPDFWTTKADTDFAAGANVALEIGTLSDSNGMPLRAKQIKVRCTAHTGTGEYLASAAGVQVEGYR